MDPAGELTQLLERERELLARADEQLMGGVAGHSQAATGRGAATAKRDEALLGAVVQVALETPALGVARLDDPRPRAGELLAGLLVRERERHQLRELADAVLQSPAEACGTMSARR